MRLVLVELDVLAQVARLAVDAGAAIAVDADLLEEVVVVFAVDLVDGRAHLDFRALGQRQQVLGHLVGRADRQGFAADWAVRRAHRREEHAQVIRDVRHRPDRRAWIGADGFLIDRDDRRQPVDEIDVRFLELSHKPLGEGGHRRQQPALPLGVDRVEGERGFAGAAHPCDDGELVARDLDVDVLEVVLAGSADLDRGSHVRPRRNTRVLPPVPCSAWSV